MMVQGVNYAEMLIWQGFQRIAILRCNSFITKYFMEKFFIVAKSKNNTPEILVYGVIGSDDTNSTLFVKALKELEQKHSKINVRINSEGGSVLQGLAMYSAMVNSKAEIDTYVDGFAGSMAAVLAMGGKRIYMSKYARLMTHSSSGAAGGNADEMRNTAKLLDSLDNTMCVIYANRTGKTAEQCLTDYVSRKEDKWFTPEEALVEKLIDGIYDGEPLTVPANISASTAWKFYDEHRFAAIFKQAQTQNENMKIEISAASKAALGITGEVMDFTALDTAIAALKTKADKADAADVAKAKAENDLKEYKETAEKAEATALLDAAVKDKKMTVELKNELSAQFKGNLEGLKKIVATLKPYESKVPVAGEGNDDELSKLSAKSYSQLDKAGELPRLKELSIDVFKAKYKERYKTEYKGE